MDAPTGAVCRAVGRRRPKRPTVALREWRSLFNGRDLSGWVVEDRPELWTVEDGAIVCQGRGGGMLRSQEQFGDFALALEYNVNPRVNSGVFVRWSDIRDPVNTGIEVQVLDQPAQRNPGKHDFRRAVRSGRPVRQHGQACRPVEPHGDHLPGADHQRAPERAAHRRDGRVALHTPRQNPDGTGNKFRYAMGALPRRGYIGLQNHGGRVLYRNLRVLVLDGKGSGSSRRA
jgi:hypothetical protein